MSSSVWAWSWELIILWWNSDSWVKKHLSSLSLLSNRTESVCFDRHMCICGLILPSSLHVRIFKLFDKWTVLIVIIQHSQALIWFPSVDDDVFMLEIVRVKHLQLIVTFDLLSGRVSGSSVLSSLIASRMAFIWRLFRRLNLISIRLHILWYLLLLTCNCSLRLISSFSFFVIQVLSDYFVLWGAMPF